MKYRSKAEWQIIDQVKSEEDDVFFYGIYTYHKVKRFDKNKFGRKTGLCERCHLIVNFECKDICIMEQIRDIHER